jgi:hypothetical protein
MDAQRRARATLVAGMAALVCLAGCGGGGAQSAQSTTSQASTVASVPTPPTTSTSAATPTTSTSAATPVSTPATTSPPPSSSISDPGTVLKAGQTATVLYTPPLTTGKHFKLKITVESIQKGSLADFNGIQLDASQKASTPYYVTARLLELSSGDASANNNDPSVAIEGIDITGSQQQSVTFFGNFPRCNAVSAPKPLTQGKSFQTCLTFLVPGGITKAAWTGADNYISSPVTWSP